MICTLLTMTLALGLPPQDLDDRLEDALADLRNRDEAMAEEVEHALEHDLDSALEFLEQHAEYLDMLREAPPRLRSLMLRQEALQVEVDDAVDQLHGAYDELEEGLDRSEAAEVERARGRVAETAHVLRDRIDRWFELRNRIRLVEIELAEEELVDLAGYLERLRGGEAEAEARERWLERALDGGPEEMQQRILEWEEHDRWYVLEGLLRELFEEYEGEDHEEELTLDELVEWAEGAERPEVLERAHREAGPFFHMNWQLVELQRLLVDHAGEDEVVLDSASMEQVQALVTDLITIELDAGLAELEGLREEIREGRRVLERREEHRDLILAVKYAELLGYDEFFDW